MKKGCFYNSFFFAKKKESVAWQRSLFWNAIID